MSYTDQDKLELAFGADEILQLTDRTRTGDVDSEVLEAAIGIADDTIDGYLRAAGYALPLAEDYPVVLVDIANKLTRAALYVHKKPEEIANQEKAALATLRDIQAGRLKPFPATAAAPDAPGTVAYSTPDQVYTPETLAGY